MTNQSKKEIQAKVCHPRNAVRRHQCGMEWIKKYDYRQEDDWSRLKKNNNKNTPVR